MASTAQLVLASLAGSLVIAANAAAAPAPETATLSPAATEPPCTVRLNFRDKYETRPVSYLYVDTAYADPKSDKYEPKLFSYNNWSWSGVTLDQRIPINGTNPEKISRSFQAEANQDGWNMGDHHYDSSAWFPKANLILGSWSTGLQGYLFDSKNTTWTKSAEVAVRDPEICLSIRNDLENKTPPRFHVLGILGESSDGFAQKVWAKTGKPADFEILKKDPTVKILSRDELSGEPDVRNVLQSDRSQILAPWKP